MQLVLSFFYIVISITTLILLYKAVAKYLKNRAEPKPSFCELVSIERQPVSGMIEFCFTCEELKKIDFDICDLTFETVVMISSDEFSGGQHILKFDTTTINDGEYFYRLRTENQQIFKKIIVKNK